jgi:hypothetical protein
MYGRLIRTHIAKNQYFSGVVEVSENLILYILFVCNKLGHQRFPGYILVIEKLGFQENSKFIYNNI